MAGGGAAGLSAALMLGRARRRVLVIDAGSPRNRFASNMHGVLGMEGLPPSDLVARGRAEVAGYGVEFLDGRIDGVKHTATGLEIVCADGQVFASRTLIVATGLTDDLPPIPGLQERWGTTVLHCPYCHGWEVGDQRLGVLGTSPLSMHQAEIVRQWSDRITVFTHGMGELTPQAQDRLRSRGLRLETTEVVALHGEGTALSSVRLADGRDIAIDALFTFGVPRPHDSFLDSLGLARTELPTGSVIATDAMGRTSDERVWVAGNTVNPGGSVPVSMGAGSFAGASANAALVGWEFDEAQRDG